MWQQWRPLSPPQFIIYTRRPRPLAKIRVWPVLAEPTTPCYNCSWIRPQVRFRAGPIRLFWSLDLFYFLSFPESFVSFGPCWRSDLPALRCLINWCLWFFLNAHKELYKKSYKEKVLKKCLFFLKLFENKCLWRKSYCVWLQLFSQQLHSSMFDSN